MSERLPGSTAAPDAHRARARAYWKSNVRLIAVLLVFWAAVSYGCGILLVEPLNRFKLGALPLGYWFANQGALLVFVVLVFVYAWRMDRLDRQHDVGERPRS